MCPPAKFSANAAALTVMAHNLGRAVGILAGPDLQRPPRTPAAQAVLRSWATRALRPAAAPETSRPLVRSWQTTFATALAAIAAIPIRC